MSEGTPAMWMRGGTSKGLYFLKDDIPVDIAKRENFLLSVFGSPDNLQINGVGGGSPCLLYTSPSPRDRTRSRMPSSA